jgi:EAL domain-containing protein (putative c-di-GMP-specific phosphodiesterase class I)
VELAHAHGLRVIGEGVETNEQLHLLQSLGCDEMQGFLLGGPVFDAEGMDWLGDRSSAVTNIPENLRHLSQRLADLCRDSLWDQPR